MMLGKFNFLGKVDRSSPPTRRLDGLSPEKGMKVLVASNPQTRIY